MDNVQLRVDIKMKCIIQLARKCIVDNLEQEIEKNNINDEYRDALIEKLTEILEGELVINKAKSVVVPVNAKRIPVDPVNIRGTPLKLKIMPDNAVYRRFCTNVANVLGYSSDFSDAPFNNLMKNTRVYEALKYLHVSGQLDQDKLDQMVKTAETEK